MALGDVSIIYPVAGLPPAQSFRTEAAATVINAGEPCKVGGTGSHYAVPSADAEPVTSSPTFLGIASSTSTQTPTLDGLVYVDLALPGMVFSARATSAAAIDTDAELLAVTLTKVAFDLTSGSYTVDTASAGATNGLIILGGDIVNGFVYFTVRATSTFLN